MAPGRNRVTQLALAYRGATFGADDDLHNVGNQGAVVTAAATAVV